MPENTQVVEASKYKSTWGQNKHEKPQGPEKYTEILSSEKVWRVPEGLNKYEESQIIWKSTGGCA